MELGHALSDYLHVRIRLQHDCPLHKYRLPKRLVKGLGFLGFRVLGVGFSNPRVPQKKLKAPILK